MVPSMTGATSTMGDAGRGAQLQAASALLLLVQRGRSSSRAARGAGMWGGGGINPFQRELWAQWHRAGGDAVSVLGGRCSPCHWRAIRRLLSAFLTRLSCPSVCLRPLCSGAALPAPGGSLGSVNGYHTCKGELAVPAVPRPPHCPCPFVCAFPSERV